MQETKKFRVNLGTFDLVKGIAMMVVVMGHVIGYYDISKMPVMTPVFMLMAFAASGLMPLFFMISGFGFKEKPVGVMLKKTANELLKPYLLVMLFVALLFPLIHFLTYGWWPGALNEGIRYVLAFLLGLPKYGKVVLGFSLYECSVVWFFLAMFLAVNILNLILKIRNECLRIALVVGCVTAAWGLYVLDVNYYCLPQGLAVVGFCYIGYLFKKYKLLERLKSTKALYGIYLVLFLITLWQSMHDRYNIAYGLFANFGLDYLCAACGGILLLLWGAYGGQAEWKGLGWLRKIGMYSYWIMCIHSVEQTCIPWYQWSNTMVGHQFLGLIVELSIKAVIYTAVCLILKRITRYQYLRKRGSHGK